MYVCILRARVQPTLDPYAEAFLLNVLMLISSGIINNVFSFNCAFCVPIVNILDTTAGSEGLALKLTS